MRTTQTGVPIVECGDCGHEHSVLLKHCVECGRASHFIDPDGWCVRCGGLETRQAYRSARDRVVCACGHPNVSHGYGTDAAPVGPFRSRIGEGECGICDCARFKETQ